MRDINSVLIVSPAFIPTATVGKARMVSLVKYIKANTDWKVTVLQSNIDSYEQVTDDEPIEGVEIIEAKTTSGFKDNAESFKCAFEDYVAKNHTKFDAAIVSIGPFYTLPIVKTLKSHGIRTLIDYRDLWTRTYRNNESESKLKLMVKSMFYEKPALKACDEVIICAEGQRAVLLDQYKFLKNKPIHCIMNGYDDVVLSEVESKAKNPSDDEIVIGVFGKLDVYVGAQNMPWFAESLGNFAQTINKKVRFLHLGREEATTKEFLERNDVIYDCKGFVKYIDGMKILADEVDIFLAANDVMIGYGTKLFDYIYLNRPMLVCCSKNSDLERITNKFENGYAFSTADELSKALNNIVESKATLLDANVDSTTYARSVQNKKFVSVIESV